MGGVMVLFLGKKTKQFLSVVWLLGVMLTVVWGNASSAKADQTAPKLDILFQQLKGDSLSSQQARKLEQQIWQLWIEGQDERANALMQQSILMMEIGAFELAQSYLDRLVQLYPQFSEGWNKRATLAFMRGAYDQSVADIQKTLALEPRHFGALAGLGTIYVRLGDFEGAIEVYEATLEINPRMDHLRLRIRELQALLQKQTI